MSGRETREVEEWRKKRKGGEWWKKRRVEDEKEK